MSEHLPSFAFDALVTDDPGSAGEAQAWRAHVETCPECAATLEARRTEFQQIAADPRFSAWRPPTPFTRPRRWPIVAVTAVAMAAGVMLLVPSDPGVRVKGRIETRFVDASGNVVSSAKSGDVVSLQGAPVDAVRALLLVRDGDAWSVLGPIEVRSATRFGELRVTPGTVEAWVVFLGASASPESLPARVPSPESLRISGEIERIHIVLPVSG